MIRLLKNCRYEIKKSKIDEGLYDYEKVLIRDAEYLINNAQGFGAENDIRDYVEDLRAMVRNSKRVKTADDALYLLQTIRNTCDTVSAKAQEIIDVACNGLPPQAKQK